MKRTTCILIMIALLCGASACADRHLDIRFTPSGNPDAAVTFDLYEQEGAMYTISSLFPEYAYRSGLQKCISVTDLTALIALRSGLAAETEKNVGSLFTSWLEKRLSDPRYDNWAGEFFDSASSMRYAEFRLDELIALFDPQTVPGDVQDAEGPGFPGSLVYRMIRDYRDSDLTVSVSSFDDGKYLSASVNRGEDVLMTVSSDCSASGGIRVQINYREEGKYYYRYADLRYGDDSYTVSTSLFSGEDSSFLQSNTGDMLFSETFIVKDDPDMTNRFEWMFYAPAIAEPFVVSGTAALTEDGSFRLEASGGIGDLSEEILRISASAEPLARQVLFTDKEIVETDNKTGNEGIMTSAAAGLLQFAAEIIPALPDTYLNLILNLLNQ